MKLSDEVVNRQTKVNYVNKQYVYNMKEMLLIFFLMVNYSLGSSKAQYIDSI